MTLSAGKVPSNRCLVKLGICARSTRSSSGDVDDHGRPLRLGSSCSQRGRLQSISRTDLTFTCFPSSVMRALLSSAEMPVDIDMTSGGVGMYSAGGPFGHGLLVIEAYGKASGRTCLFGGPCDAGGSSGCLLAHEPVSIDGYFGSDSIGGRGG